MSATAPLTRQQRRALERRAGRPSGCPAPAPAPLLRRFLAAAGMHGGGAAIRDLAPHVRLPVLLALREHPGTPPDVLMDALEEVWVAQHGHLLRAFPDHEDLRAFFRQANFPPPDDLPDAFPLYRGTCGVAAEVAVRGFSWTTDPDTAAHYAVQKHREGWPAPVIVLRTEARREDVIFAIEDMGHQEIILRGIPDAWEVLKQTPEEMAEAADRAAIKTQEFMLDAASGLHGASLAAERCQDWALRLMVRGRA